MKHFLLLVVVSFLLSFALLVLLHPERKQYPKRKLKKQSKLERKCMDAFDGFDFIVGIVKTL